MIDASDSLICIGGLYLQTPLPLHFPLVVPETKHRAFGLLNVAGPQNRVVVVPRHRGNL